jgi:hypothetical protein
MTSDTSPWVFRFFISSAEGGIFMTLELNSGLSSDDGPTAGRPKFEEVGSDAPVSCAEVLGVSCLILFQCRNDRFVRFVIL